MNAPHKIKDRLERLEAEVLLLNTLLDENDNASFNLLKRENEYEIARLFNTDVFKICMVLSIPNYRISNSSKIVALLHGLKGMQSLHD